MPICSLFDKRLCCRTAGPFAIETHGGRFERIFLVLFRLGDQPQQTTDASGYGAMCQPLPSRELLDSCCNPDGLLKNRFWASDPKSEKKKLG